MTAHLLDESALTTEVTTDTDGLAERLAEHVVAGALVRKSVTDPVPFAVWWRVADALRASHGEVANALAELDATMAALRLATENAATVTSATPIPRYAVDGHELPRARVLVARLLFSSEATSPTLLQVRLARLRRALADV